MLLNQAQFFLTGFTRLMDLVKYAVLFFEI